MAAGVIIPLESQPPAVRSVINPRLRRFGTTVCMYTDELRSANSGIEVKACTTGSTSKPYFGAKSRSMSAFWLALRASRIEKAQSSISFISSVEASRTTRRICSTPKAAWRDSSWATRLSISESSGFFDSLRSMSMMPTAVPSKRTCMPRIFFCIPSAFSRMSSSVFSVGEIGCNAPILPERKRAITSTWRASSIVWLAA